MLISRYSPSFSVGKSTLGGAPRTLLSRVVDEDRVTLAEACGYSIDFFSLRRYHLASLYEQVMHLIFIQS